MNDKEKIKIISSRCLQSKGKTYESKEEGAYVLLGWKGKGTINDLEIIGGDPNSDEFFITYETATNPHTIRNHGKEEFVFYKIFGPDIHIAPIIYN